jgi:hypothetical protein
MKSLIVFVLFLVCACSSKNDKKNTQSTSPVAKTTPCGDPAKDSLEKIKEKTESPDEFSLLKKNTDTGCKLK